MTMRSLVRTVLAALVLMTPQLAFSQTSAGNHIPLSAHAYPMSGFMEDYGPDCGPAKWGMRKQICDVVDMVAKVETLETHPLIDPEMGPLISTFHHARFWAGIRKLAKLPAPQTGVRLGKWYSSGWTVQSKMANGKKFTFAVDISEGPFDPNIHAPLNRPIESSQIRNLARQLDAYFITHSHIDHISPNLIAEMINLGKLVVAPQSLRAAAISANYPLASHIVALTSSSPVQYGPLEFRAFLGWQFGSFLDPANTVPNLNDPFNTENNCYLFKLGGKTIAHFGDNNDYGVINFYQNAMADNWGADVLLNLGQLTPQLVSMSNPNLDCLTHDLEFHHFGAAFLRLGLHWQGPQNSRRVLMWGESLHLP